MKYSDVNPYYSPAEREEDLYVQIKSQGITTIQSKSIEYVVATFFLPYGHNYRPIETGPVWPDHYLVTRTI